jgi:hypothetical protein
LTVSATAPQRYSLISSQNLILYPSFALATRLTPWLDAGLSLELRYFHIQQTQSIFARAWPSPPAPRPASGPLN